MNFTSFFINTSLLRLRWAEFITFFVSLGACRGKVSSSTCSHLCVSVTPWQSPLTSPLN